MKSKRVTLSNPKPREDPTCEICSSDILERFTREGFTFYECSNCNHLQYFPLPSEADLKRFYERGFGASGSAVSDEAVLAFAKRATGDFPLKIFQELELSKDSSILDVGCSFGYDLYAFSRICGVTRLFGIELSEAASQIAKRVLGVRVESSLDKLEGQQFDFIYLKHNLEHHPHPHTILKNLAGRLKDGGYLLVGVPNRKSPNGLWGKRWEWMTPPTHIHFFSRESLRRVVTESGFHYIRFYSQRGHGQPFLKHLVFFSPWLGRFAVRWIGGPYHSEEVRFPVLRTVVEGISKLLSWVLSPISCPLKSYLLIGEELWVLAKNNRSE